MTFPLLLPQLPASITAAESAELAARMAALANSGLPLEGGLKALAEEIGRPRLARVLRGLAARLEKGEKLETAIAAAGSRLPAMLRGMIVAGIQSGRLPEMLDQFAALSRRRFQLRRRLLATFAYPAMLLGFIAALLILCHEFLAVDFMSLFHDFGLPLPDITDMYFRYSGVLGWTVLAFAIAMIVVPLASVLLPLGSRIGRAFSLIPFLGPAVRQERYVQFSRLLATMLDAVVPLPDALNLVAIGMRGTMLEAQSRAAAAAVQSGMALDAALAKARFLATLVCFADWGQRQNDLAKAFRSAADSFEARANSQVALLNMLVLPLAYMFVITYIAFTILALIIPMFSLIRLLCGGYW